MKIPNLEAMDPQDLETLQRNVIDTLSLITHTLLGKRARMEGRIPTALHHEAMADGLYDQIPEDWTW